MLSKENDLNLKDSSLNNFQFSHTHPTNQIRLQLESDAPWYPCSVEYLNYALALLIFSVRYSSVFWKTNKSFSLIFSLQMMTNGIHNLVFFSAISIIYKVHVIGPQYVLLKYQSLTLNSTNSLILYILACILITSSPSVISMYGYHQFIIFQSSMEKTVTCPYSPNISALVILLLLTACTGPVIHDCMIIYKDSHNIIMLVFVIITILHLFFWIILWLLFTVKHS